MSNFMDILRDLVHYKGTINSAHQCSISELIIGQAIAVTHSVEEKAKAVKRELQHLEQSKIG